MPRRNYRSRPYRRRSRPTDRVIQAQTTTASPVTTVVAYNYLADEPVTATNFRLDIGTSANSAPIAYALVVVPDGYNANTLTYPTSAPTNFYEPVQNVLISGVISINNNGLEDHKSSRYSRKLKEGDRIALLIYNAYASAAQPVAWEMSFTTVH